MPPPPPPPPASGPPRGLNVPVKTGGSMDRSALLSSIQKGMTLKKAVTNDRSSPIIDNKISSSKPSANGTIQGPPSGGGMVNGGVPQLGGLFAGGMPKLRPTGRGRNAADITDSGPLRPSVGSGAPLLPVGKKPSAPPTPPSSAKPTHQPSQSYVNHNVNDQSPSNGYLPPSPKPSSKSSPAPPPPPSNRKPSMSERGTPGGRAPFMDIPPPSSKPVAPKPSADMSSSNQNEERHPPLPMKPSFKVRPEPGYRGAPPRPPSASKPNLPPKSPDLKPSGGPRRPSIDRSVSLREPQRPPFAQVRVGTSAESPAAPFRVNTNHREAPPIPSSRPLLSKTVGRAAGAKLMPALRPPSERPPKPPSRPVVAAPPPPSQPPPPPPPAHKSATAPTLLPGGKGDVPLPPIPLSAMPPPPPERNESTRTTYNKQPDDFESKFSNLFKSRHQFPLPLIYNNVPKTYPSKNNAKNQRRAPQPPTSTSAPSQQSSTNSPVPPFASSKPSSHFGHSPSTFSHSMGGNNPPPPPPHAPLHLQMDRKFYGTEASHC